MQYRFEPIAFHINKLKRRETVNMLCQQTHYTLHFSSVKAE